jgi:hypothetical protein
MAGRPRIGTPESGSYPNGKEKNAQERKNNEIVLVAKSDRSATEQVEGVAGVL